MEIAPNISPTSTTARWRADTVKRETLESICEIVGGIVLGLLALVLFWLSLFVTPDQNSAEFDAAQESRQAEMNGEG